MGWVIFSLLERPYYDRHGRVLGSIAGRRNRKGVDEFYGGGRIYPDLSGVRVLARHERGEILLVQIDAAPAEAAALAARTDSRQTVATHRVRQGGTRRRVYPVATQLVNFQDFKPQILTDEEATKLLEEWGYCDPESGVTP